MMSPRCERDASTKRKRKRRGTAVVEFALVTPFLIILVLGMMEMSRMMMVKVALSDAARVGCQTGAMPGKSNQQIAADVLSVMSKSGFDTRRFDPPALGSIVVTITDPNGNSVSDASVAVTDSTVSVQVTIPVSSTTWVTSRFTSKDASESETAVMKKQ
jgi:Flp pilus assembly protein TadG